MAVAANADQVDEVSVSAARDARCLTGAQRAIFLHHFQSKGPAGSAIESLQQHDLVLTVLCPGKTRALLHAYTTASVIVQLSTLRPMGTGDP